MAQVFNPILYGSGGGLTPRIVVTAPTGSTVKLDGVTGTEVSGTWAFDTTIGTHTVLASLGSQSKTETVNVTSVQIYTVTIEYPASRLYLYRDGDACEEVTGGWMRKYNYDGSTGNLSMNTSNMTVTCRRSYGYGYGVITICTNNLINFTNYSSFGIEFVNGSEACRVVVMEYADTKNNSNDGTRIGDERAASGIYAVDVSSITGSHYPVIKYTYSVDNTSTYTLTITKVWLE